MIDLAKLENVRHRGAKVEARCPACAEAGADTSGNHLFIAEDGRFGCIVNHGPDGAAHRKRIHALVGGAATAPAKPIPAKPKPARTRTPLLDLRPLTVAEIAAIQHARNWPSFAGLEFLTQRGLLWFARVWDYGAYHPAWLITDSTRRNAQARRMDGKWWAGIDAKAKTLKGYEASWPIGSPEIGSVRNVVLCEGQPDFAAALLVAWWEGVEVAPVCMAGAGNSIPPDSFPHFAGKSVRIAVHDDEKGREAAKKWARQLYEAEAERVTGFDFGGMCLGDGRPVKDLADYATMLDLERPDTARVFAGM